MSKWKFELIENAVKEWANCFEAIVDTNGDIWIEGPQTGHWLSEDKIVEFWGWFQAQSCNRSESDK
jgi:hypothetical protein